MEIRNNLKSNFKILTDSPQSKTYWAKMKERDAALSQPFPFWEQLKIIAEDEKMRENERTTVEIHLSKDSVGGGKIKK